MNTSTVLSYAFFKTIDTPLEKFHSKKSSLLIKTISAIAIAILSVASIGVYAVYAYRFFEGRKVYALFKQLTKAVEEDKDVDAAKQLLEQKPILKDYLNVILQKGGTIPRASLLPTAIENEDLKMVELLINHGALPSVSSHRTSSNSFETAIKTGNLEILQCLGERFSFEEDEYNSLLELALSNKIPNRLDVVKYLVEKDVKVDVTIGILNASALAVLAKEYYPKDPGTWHEIIELMIEKGAVLLDTDDTQTIPNDALDFIEFCLSMAHGRAIALGEKLSPIA